MKPLRFAFILVVFAVLLIPGVGKGGTLDESPFKIAVPGSEWQVADSWVQSMRKDVFLYATITNTSTQSRSLVIKTVLHKTTDSSLEELCAGILKSFTNPAVKKISDENVTFLGFKARKLVYEVSQAIGTTYNETIVFTEEGKGWTIVCVGRAEQKEEIKKIIGFYQKKEG